MKLSKRTYLHGFTFIVFILALLRLFTDIEHGHLSSDNENDSIAADTAIIDSDAINNEASSLAEGQNTLDNESANLTGNTTKKESATALANVSPTVFPVTPHKIFSVSNYDKAFPDSNNVQLIAAEKYGVGRVANREDAEKRKSELVYVGANPYFATDKLRSSIPYLVPRAAILLQDIGKAYYDSLQVKGVPLHTIIATSLLRSKDDVDKLRRHNPNASENSCHMYGTTFDIAQNRFVTVEDPDGPRRRAVTNDTLKWILSEVLRDMREQGRCYIKYEKKQGCFHITTR